MSTLPFPSPVPIPTPPLPFIAPTDNAQLFFGDPVASNRSKYSYPSDLFARWSSVRQWARAAIPSPDPHVLSFDHTFSLSDWRDICADAYSVYFRDLISSHIYRYELKTTTLLEVLTKICNAWTEEFGTRRPPLSPEPLTSSTLLTPLFTLFEWAFTNRAPNAKGSLTSDLARFSIRLNEILSPYGSSYSTYFLSLWDSVSGAAGLASSVSSWASPFFRISIDPADFYACGTHSFDSGSCFGPNGGSRFSILNLLFTTGASRVSLHTSSSIKARAFLLPSTNQASLSDPRALLLTNVYPANPMGARTPFVDAVPGSHEALFFRHLLCSCVARVFPDHTRGYPINAPSNLHPYSFASPLDLPNQPLSLNTDNYSIIGDSKYETLRIYANGDEFFFFKKDAPIPPSLTFDHPYGANPYDRTLLRTSRTTRPTAVYDPDEDDEDDDRFECGCCGETYRGHPDGILFSESGTEVGPVCEGCCREGGDLRFVDYRYNGRTYCGYAHYDDCTFVEGRDEFFLNDHVFHCEYSERYYFLPDRVVVQDSDGTLWEVHEDCPALDHDHFGATFLRDVDFGTWDEIIHFTHPAYDGHIYLSRNDIATYILLDDHGRTYPYTERRTRAEMSAIDPPEPDTDTSNEEEEEVQ